MGRIIPLRDDPHERVEMLLPWYAKGQLDADEHAEVERHLAVCPRCRDERDVEDRLRVELSSLPPAFAGDWDRMRGRMRVAAIAPRKTPLWRQPWVIAAQAACLMLAVTLIPARSPEPGYHALGTPGVAQPGNLIVMFRPDASEQDMRRVLTASGARIVDGPTAAGAYVLRVPPAAREAALGRLRGQAAVTLAQPIDPEPRP